jgi:hypothetical protein
MATWTTITDAALEPGKPIRSVDGLALRDNSIAIAEGASGAPKIQNAAMDANSVDNANVVNGNLGAEKFQSGGTERNWVLGRTSDAGAGAVGTYVMGKYTKTFDSSPAYGDVVSGSLIEASNTSGSYSYAVLSGTWRTMGGSGDGEDTGNDVTLYLRIS